MQSRWRLSLEGQTAGYVSRKTAAVRASRVTGGALAVSGHGVADSLRTPFDMFHLVGPVPVADLLLGPVVGADVDRILSSAPTHHSAELNIYSKYKVVFQLKSVYFFSKTSFKLISHKKTLILCWSTISWQSELLHSHAYKQSRTLVLCLLPHGSTAPHTRWCRPARWDRSPPPGCWRWSGDSRSCSPAQPSPGPALLPWQPAASSAGCSADAWHKRGTGTSFHVSTRSHGGTEFVVQGVKLMS